MLECPFCDERVALQGREGWSECPNCGNLVRRRVNRDGAVWVEAGVFVNDTIQPVQLRSRRDQPVRAAPRAPNPAPRRMFPNVNELDLATVRTQRQQAALCLRELDENIDRVYRLRTENRQNNQLMTRYNEELGQFTRDQNEWRRFSERLAQRESQLLEEQAQARQAASTGPGVVIVLGALLAAADLYMFARLINLSLDPRAIFVAGVIAIVSGFLTVIIAQFR